MAYSVQDYLELPVINLPWHGEEMDVTLTELNGHCARCNGGLKQIKGRVYEIGHCVEISFAGVCSSCRILTTCRMRWYPKDHRVMFKRDGDWVHLITRPSVLRTVLEWVKERVRRWN